MNQIMRRLVLLISILLMGFPGAVVEAQHESVNHVTHGPILGRLGSHQIGVWARTRRHGQFVVRYGLASDNLNQESQPVVTSLDHDNTGWVLIKGLKADTKYYYQVVILDAKATDGRVEKTGRAGSFLTLPDEAEHRDPKLNPRGLFNFRFEYACGNNQNPYHSVGPALPTFKTMLEELKDNVHFAILNGDWLYESQRLYQPEQWLGQVRETPDKLPEVLQVAPTLVGVWENYKHFLDQGPNLARWHRQMPSFFTYDDHEILNDVWGAGSPGLRDRRAVFRDVGVRAWYDYLGWSNPTSFQQPVHFGLAQLTAGNNVLTDLKADFTRLDLSQASNLHVHWGGKTAGVNENELDGVGGHPSAGVYRIVKVLDRNRLQIEPPPPQAGRVSYSIGRRSYFRMRISNCDFFVCDTRGQRQMHDKQNPGKKGISMLGLEQRKWLLEAMRKSDADFLFVVSSVNFMIPHVGGGKVRADNKDDAWTVFYEEREMLIDAWDALKQPVFVLTGDLHNSFVCKITENVWEFASGPHNSNNHWSTDEGDRPANGKFQYGPRPIDIRWSTHFRNDIPRNELSHPTYCVVQLNNVYNNPQKVGQTRWVAYPRPQVIFQYYDGRTGKLRYAESILANPK